MGVYQGLYHVIRDEDGLQRVLRADQQLDNVATGVAADLPTLEDFTSRVRAQLSSRPPQGESLP